MNSIIDENSFTLNNQITSGSRSSILLSHVEFKRTEEEDDLMSSKCLQTKYNVLTNDSKLCFNNKTNNELVVRMNGQNKITTNGNNITNGNNSDNNNDGIPVPKHVLYPREKVLLEWKEPHKIGAGLTNMGNTCFLNSVLQCLTYCPPLVNFLIHTDDHNPNKCNLNFCMICEMSRHIRNARTHCGEAIKPINICRRLKSIAKHFTFGRQEDAHEFLRYVIDNMWRSGLNSHDIQNLKLDPLSKETTAINQIFGGYHRSQVICFQCKGKSNTYDYFMDFMLDIKNVTSLEKALDKFVAPEILQSDDAYRCTRCKKKVLAKKQFTVFRAPNVATFQFKRFDYNRIFGGKITKPVSYPEKLNLRPYMSDNKGSPILYKLNSVLVHLGPTCNSGHYFCYVRNSNNMWYLMDDSRIIQVNQNQALNQQAYVLFYVRIDTDFHKPTPVKNFISQTTPNGIKLSNISSPELAFRNQKLNNFNSHTVSFSSAQNIQKLNSPINALKPIQSEAIKESQNVNKHKQSSSESVNNHIKGLVPYASDSSDEESPKPTNCLNGSLDSNCDKLNNNNNKLSLNENNLNEKISQKIENILPKVKTNSDQNIPNPKPKININSIQNNTSESASFVPLAPITLKVKATTSSWHVVETALRSPSIASNSSTNSVNSTTEWTVSECLPECNGNQHSKHHKHRNPNNNNNRCPTIANTNVSQVLSTKHKIPQSELQINEKLSELKTGANNQSNGAFEAQSHSVKCTETLIVSPKKNEIKSENSCLVVNCSIESNELKFKENHSLDSNNSIRRHFDRRSISSHRSSNESIRDVKIRNKESDKSRSKSINSEDDRSTSSRSGSSHKHEKKKHRKRKLEEKSRRKTSDSDSNEELVSIKTKHKKKKKQKKKKHKKIESSDSESHDSDNQLQWIERTKETVEKERNTNINTADTSGTNNSKSDIIVKEWNEKIRDLGHKKRGFDEESHQKQIVVENNSNEALNGLLKTTIRGYGEKVNSWSGGPSSLDVSLNEEKRYTNELQDEYDEEFDRGKTKKLKTNGSEKAFDSNKNPFQKIQTERHRFNGTSNSHRNNPHFDKHFKDKHNNHNSLKSYHNRNDKERRH